MGYEKVYPQKLPLSPAAPPLLVGRDGVVAQLHQWLAHVRQGARQIVWLTGEPGIGKTAVVNAFVAQAATAGDLWLARGQCVDHYGAGEAYLPVLEALGRLGREPAGAALLPVLEQQAPTWLAQMPALLSATALEAVQQRVQGVTQERMLRELAEAVEVLTATRPLLLVLEDLHWSDYATLDLLTYLARRPGPARLLILGTYRPVEVLLRGHPLQTVKQDLMLHGQAVELPLELLTVAEVVQYLALRGAGDADLPPAVGELAQLLCQRTDGHPLFLVQVVEHVLQRGVLGAGAGPWQVPPEAIAAAMEIPTGVRELIELQFERLSPAEQRVLEAASVAGSACTAAAVAAGLELAVEAVEDGCAGLTQRGQFLVASGLETWPDGTVTERYGWQHAVHQEVVYARVPEGRRLRLHRRIGAREEAGYGARVSERAAVLAIHFERGQDSRRAVQYFGQAAENAMRRSAYHESIGLLTRGLALLAHLPDTPERAQQELDLHLALGPVIVAAKGHADLAVEGVYTRALQLCQQVGQTPKRFPVLFGLWRFHNARLQFHQARELGEQCLLLAQQAGEPALLLEAHFALGSTLFFLGEILPAHGHFEQGAALYNPAVHQSLAWHYGLDPGVWCVSHAAQALWCLGYPDQARHRIEAALALAAGLAHPLSLMATLFYAAMLHCFRREGRAAQERAEAALALANRHAFPQWSTLSLLYRGLALALQGHHAEGMAQMQQGLAAYQGIGAQLVLIRFLVSLAEEHGKAGEVRTGLAVLAEAQALMERTAARLFEAELHRLNGELLLALSSTAQVEAEQYFTQALALARHQQAKTFELRAATSLARLWQRQGKRAAARELLAAVYDWFTEGFDTADLQEAKALLEELA